MEARVRCDSLLVLLVLIVSLSVNPTVTFGILLARKFSVKRPMYYMAMQWLGPICGKNLYMTKGGGNNVGKPSYTNGSGLDAEIIGTFVLVYTVFSATDVMHSDRDFHVPILVLLPIGFAVVFVHLATNLITGIGMSLVENPGAAIIYNWDHAYEGCYGMVEGANVYGIEGDEISKENKACDKEASGGG